MSKYIHTFLVTLLISTVSVAQTGKISGKVLNEKNEPLQGVSIKVEGAQKGTSTDVEGRYTLILTAGKQFIVKFSAVGYDEKAVEEIIVSAGENIDLPIILKVTSKNLEEVTVTGQRSTLRKETVNSLIQFQKNTNTVASVISAESIRRSPDRNTGEVLKRTPGASLIDGKFLVVRGLADRYNQAMLNGILLTSTEPDRKTFSFDIIPSQMIDNIIINKAFVPEYPGEWAGGLIQVNTKDNPAKAFLNIQVGTGFNAQTFGKDFYKAKGGSTDWLGYDNGSRALPSSYKNKSTFDQLSPADKTAIGKEMRNDWSLTPVKVAPNMSLQINGGFNETILGKKVGGMFALLYNKSNRYTDVFNQSQSLGGGMFSTINRYEDDRYTQEVTAGALGSLSIQIDPRNKISLKSIVNLNSNNYVIRRNGENIDNGTLVRNGGEITFKQNTFFTTQLSGEHTIAEPVKLKWYGSFNILDGYSPDQRRYQYIKDAGTDKPYEFLIGNSLAQESGSRIFQTLSDYIYTAGGDLGYTLNLFGRKQTIKAGYMLQVKDRLFDAQLFANYLPRDNTTLRQLPPDKIFAPENFGDGSENSNMFAFNSISNLNFRYLANSILNAVFLQFDNQFSDNFRLVWGLRVEDYDQLIGSVKTSDPRHQRTQQRDFLPGLNATYKLGAKTNLRMSGSQTVIRPEFRELAGLTMYDFELNSSVQGNPELERTKVTNADLRYEYYPRAGEVLTAGVFYKYFQKPIEQTLAGQTFLFQNPDRASAFGVEAEFRKRLDMISGLKNFTLQANAAYIYSRVKDDVKVIDRPLQGQSPYLLNFTLLYDLEKAGFNTTILFNQIGKRIYFVGDIPAGGSIPDIWEAPRPVLDLQIGQKLLNRKAEIRLNVSDILNRTQNFYQNSDDNTGLQKGKDQFRFTRKFGTSFNLTFNYSI